MSGNLRCGKARLMGLESQGQVRNGHAWCGLPLIGEVWLMGSDGHGWHLLSMVRTGRVGFGVVRLMGVQR